MNTRGDRPFELTYRSLSKKSYSFNVCTGRAAWTFPLPFQSLVGIFAPSTPTVAPKWLDKSTAACFTVSAAAAGPHPGRRRSGGQDAPSKLPARTGGLWNDCPSSELALRWESTRAKGNQTELCRTVTQSPRWTPSPAPRLNVERARGCDRREPMQSFRDVLVQQGPINAGSRCASRPSAAEGGKGGERGGKDEAAHSSVSFFRQVRSYCQV